MKTNNWILAGLMTAGFLTGGCSGGTAGEDIYSFGEYRGFVKAFAAEFEMPKFQKQSDTLDEPVVIIVEKGNTFGKRETLTVSGDAADQQPQPTQERIVLHDKERGYVAYLDFVYLAKSLGKDMINWDNSPPKELEQEPALRKYNQSVLAFHNIMIKTTLIATKEPGELMREMGSLITRVVDQAETIDVKK